MSQATLETFITKGTSISEKEFEVLFSSQDEGIPFKGIDEAMEYFCEKIRVPYLKDISNQDMHLELLHHVPIHYAKENEVLPLYEKDGAVVVALTNPLSQKTVDDLRAVYGKRIDFVLTTSPKIKESINQAYEKIAGSLENLDEDEDDEYELDDSVIDLLETSDDEAPVVKLTNRLLLRAVKEKASDIHIEPYEKSTVVRFRVDGVLYDVFHPPKRFHNAIVSRIKVMSKLDIAEKRKPQDGRIPLSLAGKDVDVRLSTVPTAHGERLVLRLQDRSNVILKLEDLGFSQESLHEIGKILQKTYGIFLVTGPTGSGKTTTLYACLSKVNSVDKNIITVEDPVEQRIHGIGQIQTNASVGLTFATGLRSILRQDPNIIMVGEIRDLETAEIAINASLTGHIVLSTIHTNDSSGVFPRLIDMGCEPFLIATSLLGVVAQRLVRLLCPHCKKPHKPSKAELSNLELKEEDIIGKTIFRPIGCEICNQKGYLGRTVIQELLIIKENIRSLIIQKQDGATIKKLAIQENGMKTFRHHGTQKVLEGKTSMEEVISNTQMDL